jgi:hypothetical protein
MLTICWLSLRAVPPVDLAQLYRHGLARRVVPSPWQLARVLIASHYLQQEVKE